MDVNIKLHILNTSGVFTPMSEMIHGIFNEAVEDISKLMPIRDIDVVVQYSKYIIPQIGIGASASNGNTVFILLDPQNEKYNDAISSHMKRTLAHEFHHCMRMRDPGIGETLVDMLCSEGLADHFDLELTGKSPQPWCVALSQDQLEVFKEKAKDRFWEKVDFATWFYGTKDNEYPLWGGYSLAFSLIQEYLDKNPNERASNLYMKPTKEILDNLLA